MAQLVTVGDARSAMLQLNTDIQVAAESVAAAYASSNVLTQEIGGDMVEQAAASLLQQLAQTWLNTSAKLTGADSDALTDDQIAALQELKSEVISDRQIVGQAISSVDWTFGDFASDVADQTVNLASQAVAKVVDATGFSWTYVKIGLGLAALGLGLYVGYRVFK